MGETYLYSVNPKRPVDCVNGVPTFRKSKSLLLTLEDVEKCLTKASVYRRFVNEDIVKRVDISNYKRLHNEKYMTEEEYAKISDGVTEEVDTTVAEPEAVVPEEPVAEEPVEEAPEVKEEVIPEEPAEEVDPIDAELYESDEDGEVTVAEDSVEE